MIPILILDLAKDKFHDSIFVLIWRKGCEYELQDLDMNPQDITLQSHMLTTLAMTQLLGKHQQLLAVGPYD